MNVYVRQTTQVVSNGIGFFGAAFLVLLSLKLIGFTDMSWWWVTLPLWIVPAIIFGVSLIIAIGWVALVGVEAHQAKKRRAKATQVGS